MGHDSDRRPRYEKPELIGFVLRNPPALSAPFPAPLWMFVEACGAVTPKADASRLGQSRRIGINFFQSRRMLIPPSLPVAAKRQCPSVPALQLTLQVTELF
jgi:hypothetical protein